MPNPNAQAGYRRMLDRTGQTITFRRVAGQAPNTQIFDATVTALFRNYTPAAPIGGTAHNAAITEGLREFIVLECDLKNARFPLPLQKNDRILVGYDSGSLSGFPAQGELFNITEVDYGKRLVAGAIEGKAVGV
jgi:hypothetical protein